MQIDTSMIQAGVVDLDAKKFIPASDIPKKNKNITVDVFIESLERMTKIIPPIITSRHNNNIELILILFIK